MSGMKAVSIRVRKRLRSSESSAGGSYQRWDRSSPGENAAECKESDRWGSWRSNAPYGLLSSSFHMVPAVPETAAWWFQCGATRSEVEIDVMKTGPQRMQKNPVKFTELICAFGFSEMAAISMRTKAPHAAGEARRSTATPEPVSSSWAILRGESKPHVTYSS